MSSIRPIDRWFIDEVMPHEPALLRLAQRLCPSLEEAVDLVQEAYARLFATDGWAAISNPPAYVARSIRHIAIEKLRRAKIVDFQQFVDADHAELADETPGPFRAVAGKEALARLSDALARLPARCRDVFLRRRVQGQSPREIAEATGLSVSTLEKRLARAFELLARDGIMGSMANPADEPADEERSEGHQLF